MTVITNKEKFHFWTKWTILSLLIIILGYIVGGIALLLIHGAFGYNQYEWGTPLSQTLGHYFNANGNQQGGNKIL
jgi:hypothetical protein